jgi:hypothetical protein
MQLLYADGNRQDVNRIHIDIDNWVPSIQIFRLEIKWDAWTIMKQYEETMQSTRKRTNRSLHVKRMIWSQMTASNLRGENAWARFTEIVIRQISVGTSEADCQRSLSMQRTIAGAHGTRYETPSLAARLQLHKLSTSERREKPSKQSVLTRRRECRDISQDDQRLDSALITILTFEPVIEGMMGRRRDPEMGADTEEYTDKRGEEEQAQRMKELMDGNFRTRDAVSYYSEVSGGSVWGVLICLADPGQILVFDRQHEKMYKVVRERVARLSLSEFPLPDS